MARATMGRSFRLPASGWACRCHQHFSCLIRCRWRALLPLEKEHKVGSLAKHFQCDRSDAHRADADVEMLAGIVQGLERELHTWPTGAAVYELLRRAGDPWTAVLKPPAQVPTAAEVIAPFGENLTPLLPERDPSTTDSSGNERATIKAHSTPLDLPRPYEDRSPDMSEVEEAFARAEALGRTRREA